MPTYFTACYDSSDSCILYFVLLVAQVKAGLPDGIFTTSSESSHLNQSIRSRLPHPLNGRKADTGEMKIKPSGSSRVLTRQSYVLFLIVSHMTVSSTMLILNKAVLKRMPVATTVLLAQVGSSALILWFLGKIRVLSVDPFQLSTVSISQQIKLYLYEKEEQLQEH